MSEAIFKEAVASLSPDDFREYFLTRNNVVYPKMPKPTKSGRMNADAVLKNRFELIGVVFELEEGFSWQPKRTQDKEWQIAHHKFYFAVDLIHAFRQTEDPAYLIKWVALIDAWLSEMGSGFITVSDAQVEAKRIEHWVYSFLLLKGSDCQQHIPSGFLNRFLRRIATETDYISHHLKRVRNHRTFQLFSVVLVGVLFPELILHDYFLETGIEKLTENLLTDFLTDGVHIEQSSHYHQLVMETAIAFTELTRLNGISLNQNLLRRLHAGLRFSMYLQWPTADIPLFNDSDNGNHLELLKKGAALFKDETLLWAGTLGEEGKPPKLTSKYFEQSGYFLLGDHWGCDPKSYQTRQHIFYDCGRLGEGSHSHYDLFSFCYFINGQPAIIDPGRYTYSSDPDENGVDWRHYFKSTACHNTVTIDGKNQTRYLSRTKHGPEVVLLESDHLVGKNSDWIYGQAKSEEYTPQHRRHFIYMLKTYIFIFDQINMEEDGSHRFDLYFHLTDLLPGKVSLEHLGDEALFRTPLIEIRSDCPNGVEASIDEGWVSRKYGVKTEAPIVKLSQTLPLAAFFASIVSQAAGGPSGTDIISLKRISQLNENFLQYQVDGTCYGVPFVDQFIFAKEKSADLFRSETLTLQGLFLAYRTNEAGKVTHITGQEISALSIKGGPTLQISGKENIEWTYNTKN